MKFVEVCFHMPVNKTYYYSVPERLENEVEVGKRVKVPFGKTFKNAFIINILQKVDLPTKEILKVIDLKPILNDELITLANWMSKYYVCNLGEALNCIFSLNIKSYPICQEEETIKFDKRFETLCLLHLPIEERIKKYIELIKKSKGSVLIIFPEVNLVLKFSEIFKQKSEKNVKIWHSRLSQKEKYLCWFEAKFGKVGVVVGTRSAIFLPLKNLEIIIIDQESELLPYKEEHKPNYNVVSVGIQRAKNNNCKFILGNIIPALDTYFELKKNRYRQINNEKIGNIRKKLPEIKIIDLHREKSLISTTLKEEIISRIFKNQQILLYHNRKGFSPSVMCSRCGSILKCQNCDVPLVFYKDDGILKCHYCGFEDKFLYVCKRCGVSKFRFFGTGIQKVEEELKRSFPQAKICSLHKEENIEDLSKKIEEQEIDILLTTQIIHRYKEMIDFRNFSLVGIIDIDAFLYFPDYRSSERSFYSLIELLSLFLGKKNGIVIVQTHTPNHYLFEGIKNLDYKRFYLKELMFREKFFYSPFSELINITFFSKKHENSLKEAENFKDYFLKFNIDGVYYYGPFSPKYSKIRKVWFHQFLLKVKPERIIEVNEYIKNYKKIISTTKISVDVNPIEL